MIKISSHQNHQPIDQSINKKSIKVKKYQKIKNNKCSKLNKLKKAQKYNKYKKLKVLIFSDNNIFKYQVRDIG